jgi:hypothetical protein
VSYLELNPDQIREMVNAQQRYGALREVQARVRAHRGSMVWSSTKGHDYLMRVAYDRQGRRRQSSLGPRNAQTEQIKQEFEQGREDARQRLEALRASVQRQAILNRGLGLQRVPVLVARIVRALDDAGLLGAGIRILGTNALYAYEAQAGVHIDASLTATEDVDLLFDARMRLSFAIAEDLEEASLLKLLQRVDKSFERSNQRFRASNKDGFLVDLIKPLRNPPWTREPATLSGDANDLEAIEIHHLDWLENAPAFEAVAMDQRGEPVRIVTADPRVFVVHKLWLSRQEDREPAKARRDRAQAQVIGAINAQYLHLPYDPAELRMLPKSLLDEAAPLFAPHPG